MMMEAIIHEIKALPEGLSTFQRQEANRLDAEREEAMLNRHVLPLQATAANHEKRIKAVGEEGAVIPRGGGSSEWPPLRGHCNVPRAPIQFGLEYYTLAGTAAACRRPGP